MKKTDILAIIAYVLGLACGIYFGYLIDEHRLMLLPIPFLTIGLIVYQILTKDSDRWNSDSMTNINRITICFLSAIIIGIVIPADESYRIGQLPWYVGFLIKSFSLLFIYKECERKAW